MFPMGDSFQTSTVGLRTAHALPLTHCMSSTKRDSSLDLADPCAEFFQKHIPTNKSYG